MLDGPIIYSGGPFIESLTISLIIVGVILLLGIAYEIVRWKAKKKLNVTNLEKSECSLLGI